MADAVVSISADLTALKRSLADLPNLSGEAAQQTLINVEKVVRKAETAAKSAAKAISKANATASVESVRKFEDIKRGAEKVFGGIIGDAADVATAIEAIGLAGSAAAGIGAAGLAITALIGASVSAIKSFDETEAALTALGATSGTTATQLAAISEASTALDSLSASALQAKQAFAAASAEGTGQLAASVVTLTPLIVDLGAFVGRVAGDLARGVAVTQAFAEVMYEAGNQTNFLVDALSLGSAPAINMARALDEVIPRAVANVQAGRDLAVANTDAAMATDALTKSLDSQLQMQIALGTIEDPAAGAAREKADAEALGRAKAAAAKQQADAAASLASSIKEAAAIEVAANNDLKASALETSFAQIDALDALSVAAMGNAELTAQIAAARTAIFERAEREQSDLLGAEQERYAEAAALREADVAATEAWATDTAAVYAGLAADLKVQASQIIKQSALSIADGSAILAGGISELSATIAENGNLSEAAARRAYKVSKSAGVAQVAINTAVAISAALAQLGPIAGAIAAVGITASGAAQIAAIAATPPPAFFAGGSSMRQPDASIGILHRGETVQTAASTRRDDRGSTRAANSGRAAPAPIQVQFLAGGRVVDEVMQEESARPGSGLRKAIGTPRYGQRAR